MRQGRSAASVGRLGPWALSAALTGLVAATAPIGAPAPETRPGREAQPASASPIPLARGLAAPADSPAPLLMLPVAGATPLSSAAPSVRPGTPAAEIVAIDPGGDTALSPAEWPSLETAPRPAPRARDTGPPSLEETRLFGVSRVPADDPTLADARWLGVLTAVTAEPAEAPGLWIRGPVDRGEAIGWAANPETGETVRVKLIWAVAGETDPLILSPDVARALALTGDGVHEVGIYLAKPAPPAGG